VLGNLTTETRNARTTDLDGLSTAELLQIMNEEDARAVEAVNRELPAIAEAIEAIVKVRLSGGRLIYMGAGTSGRIGLLDAVECPPTFGTEPSEIVGLIAGGEKAFIKAVEGAEDSRELGVQDLHGISFGPGDILVGIAASGRTPYVIGGLEYANSLGAETIALACNKGSEIGKHANIAIEVEVGPEVLTGSTRLKSGTAQKLVCNMLSTASMVKTGKVYGNLMVDVQTTNEKLVERAKRIIMAATDCTFDEAGKFYQLSGKKPKVAIVMILTGATHEEATANLQESGGFIRQAISKKSK